MSLLFDKFLFTVKTKADAIPLGWYALLLMFIYFLIYILGIGGLGEFLERQLPKLLTREMFWYIMVGFGAQMVDGALGMAYGVCSSTFLLSVGVTPAAASASVHVAEVFTTAASGASHYTLGNVNKRLFKALVIPGVLGGIVGAYLLSSFDGNTIKPFVSIYLFFMGILILRKALAKKIERTKIKRIGVLALAGGFLDSVGGGGWGPVVNSTLLSTGKTPRYIIGTVNTVEFFVAFASAGVFTLFMGLQNVQIVIGLILGGVIAAPIGAFLVGKIKTKPMMLMVGLLVCFLSVRTLVKLFL
ncbi:MAG: sulfite exporter TauE/SafE family protein [Chitinophagales bacterium]|nr:sulfite exporter TauE/SafE family protein [Chitinophagales bacterium]